MTKKEIAVVAIVGTFFALAFTGLSGCSGPSKARYKELLGECREHQRAYVRLLKEAGEMCGKAPQQKLGEVGMGEGGQ